MRLPVSDECRHTTDMLRIRRQAMGLSLRALAGQIGVDKSTLSNWELRKMSPNHASLVMWARALDCRIGLEVR